MRISAEQRQQNEARIRAAIDRLLGGDIPPGGKCDIKTLAREAAVDRAAFYGTRPYAHLRKEFETRLLASQQAGDIPDRRDAQIARLKDENATLRQRLADHDTTITDLRELQGPAHSPGSPPSTTRSPASAPGTSAPPRSASCRLPPRKQGHPPEPHRPASLSRDPHHAQPAESPHAHGNADHERMPRSGQANRNTNHCEHVNCKNKAHHPDLGRTPLRLRRRPRLRRPHRQRRRGGRHVHLCPRQPVRGRRRAGRADRRTSSSRRFGRVVISVTALTADVPLVDAGSGPGPHGLASARAPRCASREGPAPPDEISVPAQQSPRGDDQPELAKVATRKQPGQCGQHRPVGP